MSGKTATCAERAIALIETKPKLAELEKALPDHMTAERFARLAVTMLRRPELAECTVPSQLASILEAAQLGLYLDGVLGHAYLVPFGKYNKKLKKKVKEATLIVGYRGYIYMALRTGFVNDVSASVVYDGDEFTYQKGTEPYLRHKPTRDTDKRGNVTAAYSIITYKTGIRAFEVMERADLAVIQARALAKGGAYSPWLHAADKKEMQKKTVTRLHLKYAGLSAELTRFAVKDEYYEAGIGRDPKEIEVEVVEQQTFAETMSNGQSIAPVESSSAPISNDKPTSEAPQTGAPTPEERAKLVAEHLVLSGQLRRKRIPNATLTDMSDNTLTDAVERLRQEVAEKAKGSEGEGDADSERSPFTS